MMDYPNTIILDGVQLAETRTLLISGKDKFLQGALGRLERRAHEWLTQGPWSVVNKVKPPPSGDIHDYTSLAPYWWPSPTADGSPYVRRDGEKNPEVYNYSDRLNAENVFTASYELSLAWFYTSNESYSRHAANILRTWFISPTTRMNPNLNHAQVIPHANNGRCIGIIDFSQGYTSVIDAAILLAGDSSGQPAPGWTREDIAGFQNWNVEFLHWLTNSSFGREESAQQNNHGTFAAMQKAAIARFVGNHEQAKREILNIRERINASIASDGSQPEELERTRSWHYSIFNLLALTRIAAIGQKVGVDLWSYQGPQGQSITKAIEYLIPAAISKATWQGAEKEFLPFAAADVLRAAAVAGSELARIAVPKLLLPPDDIWVLRPAPEQLDAVRLK
ncbi:alginate lyase-domain-containing protein [Talaromyces proteolyticus]|uniref:Alginate lyase-domain-containing protein n=1 Tax=Talaromyces proteolyticus TaxID=1131652 RepID=A0AAD4KEU1_9EURO|nr:alginate lyase-domain-containing protein [Talaromyces proteolyticus]KAH8690629.1 alginate lyase-domain-containing protein [Talaromyces proteolyticus]